MSVYYDVILLPEKDRLCVCFILKCTVLQEIWDVFAKGSWRCKAGHYQVKGQFSDSGNGLFMKVCKFSVFLNYYNVMTDGRNIRRGQLSWS